MVCRKLKNNEERIPLWKVWPRKSSLGKQPLEKLVEEQSVLAEEAASTKAAVGRGSVTRQRLRSVSKTTLKRAPGTEAASQLLGTIYLGLPHLIPDPTFVTSTWQTALLPVSSCEWWYPTACPYVWGPWPSLMPTAFPCHRPGHFHVHPLSPLSRLWNKNGRITILVEAGVEHFGVCHTILFLCMFKNSVIFKMSSCSCVVTYNKAKHCFGCSGT